MKNNNSFKDKIKVLKEIWQVPRYKALIILSLYAIMFILLFSLAGIYKTSDTNSFKDTQSETSLPSLNEILNNNLNRDAKIKYTITNNNNLYVIDGEIENNLLTGYLEANEVIKKIVLRDNILYEINSNNEIYSELNNNIVTYFLLPNNIIALIKDNKAFIEKNDLTSSYSYNITYNNIQYNITLNANLIDINSIIIENDISHYEFNVSVKNF